jgi:Flp pilus assembly protein CpaB
MVLAGTLGVLLTLAVIRSADASRPVLVVAKDLPAGAVIGDDDVRVTQVAAGRAVMATLVSAGEAPSLHGTVTATALRAGTLLTRAVLQAQDAQGSARVMSFALPKSRAVAGKLVPGDRVDVVAVERDTGRSGFVVTNAQVVGVDSAGSGPLAGGTDDLTVSIVVDGESPAGIAAALDTATVTLVRATNARPLGDVRPFVPGGGVR